jgi:hypothetical protein
MTAGRMGRTSCHGKPTRRTPGPPFASAANREISYNEQPVVRRLADEGTGASGTLPWPISFDFFVIFIQVVMPDSGTLKP